MAKRKLISAVLAIIMLAALFPAAGLPAQALTSNIWPGQTVSGTLSKSNSMDHYIFSEMSIMDRWGVRLTVTVSGATKYELWLLEGYI